MSGYMGSDDFWLSHSGSHLLNCYHSYYYAVCDVNVCDGQLAYHSTQTGGGGQLCGSILFFHLSIGSFVRPLQQTSLPTGPSHQAQVPPLIGPTIFQQHHAEDRTVPPPPPDTGPLGANHMGVRTWGRSSVLDGLLGDFGRTGVGSSIKVRWNKIDLWTWCFICYLIEEMLS